MTSLMTKIILVISTEPADGSHVIEGEILQPNIDNDLSVEDLTAFK